MKIKTIVPVIGITIIVGMHALADGQAGVLYTSGAVDSSQYSSMVGGYLGLDNQEQTAISFDEELAAVSTTATSHLLDENSKYIVYYNAGAEFNVKAVNSTIKAMTIRNALQTAGISDGEFLIIGLNDCTGLDGFADALYAYQKQGGKIKQKNVQLAMEELTIASVISDADVVLNTVKTAAVSGKSITDALSKYSLDGSVLAELEVWASEYADTFTDYTELSLGTIKSDSLLVTADDSYLGEYVDISVTYEKPGKHTDSMFSCFTSKKKTSSETERDAVLTPSTEHVEISSDMIPEDTEMSTEEETIAETEMIETTEGTEETKETEESDTVSPVEVVEGGSSRQYTVIPKDDNYKFDGLSEYEKSQDSSATSSSSDETVTVVGKGDSQYDTDQYAASKEYRDDFAQNLLE